MGKRIELNITYRAPRRGPSCGVTSTAAAKRNSSPKKGPKSLSASAPSAEPPGIKFPPISAESVSSGTLAIETSPTPTVSDLNELRGKLTASLPPSEAKQLDAFLERLDRQRKTKAAQMRRYRAKQKETKV